MERIKHARSDRDWWTCICGNQPWHDGFYPCDEQGKEVEPLAGGVWDGVRYVCHGCGRIIDQHTLKVIGRAAKIAA